MMKKKIITVLLASMITISGGMAIAHADNHGDTNWSNQYRVWSPNDHTPARRKTNKTAYYNKTTATNVGYHTIWAALYDGRDASSGHSYKSYKGDVNYLWNNAVEKHGKGVSVRINSKSWNNGYARGAWSPDSVR
ncbi:hypothetical protein BSQ37_05635 [Pediococcus damnosus]|nr:hypothetical protein BSQ38_05075 [Pediococcus damnosus]PIO86225.1 hypothetical protein BSQ37_05635 [Pediococcus damnosus]PJE50281.1 hypothetical protein BSQ36_05815 [Pediococcus damnosus]